MAEYIRGATYTKKLIRIGGSAALTIDVEMLDYLGVPETERLEFIKDDKEIELTIKADYSKKHDHQFIGIGLPFKEEKKK